MLCNAGPMWLGELWDSKLAAKMAKESDEKILKIIASESKIPIAGFHNIHKLCKKNKVSKIPKTSEIMKRIRKKKHKASLTHFSPEGIRSTISEKEIVKIIKSIR